MTTSPSTPDIDQMKLILREALDIVETRGQEEGRNLARDFWETFPHGLSDMTFMLRDKVDRIMGAEKKGRDDIIRDNALDVINYAAFIIMWLDRAGECDDLPTPKLDGHGRVVVP